jgi:hypothetical protein
LGARSPFEYTIVPEELTVRTEEIPEINQQKFASSQNKWRERSARLHTLKKRLDVNKLLSDIDALAALNRVWDE